MSEPNEKREVSQSSYNLVDHLTERAVARAFGIPSHMLAHRPILSDLFTTWSETPSPTVLKVLKSSKPMEDTMPKTMDQLEAELQAAYQNHKMESDFLREHILNQKATIAVYRNLLRSAEATLGDHPLANQIRETIDDA